MGSVRYLNKRPVLSPRGTLKWTFLGETSRAAKQPKFPEETNMIERKSSIGYKRLYLHAPLPSGTTGDSRPVRCCYATGT